MNGNRDVVVSRHAGFKEMDVDVGEGAVPDIIRRNHEGGRIEAMEGGHRDFVCDMYGDVKLKGKSDAERVVGVRLMNGININLGRD